MIAKGIVTKSELEHIRSVLSQHELTEGNESSFRTWKEHSKGETQIWVEIDVHEALGNYLTRNGFFDTKSN